MKLLPLTLLITALLCGCATTQQVTYQTLAGVVAIKDTAMKAWAVYVVDEQEAIALAKTKAGDDPVKRGAILDRTDNLTRKLGKVNVALGRYRDIVEPALALAEAASRARSEVIADPSWVEAAQAIATLVSQLKAN